MAYRLYRVGSPGQDPADGELIGIFDEFDQALEARDDDAVALLASVGGSPMLACHHIVGPGLDGRDTAHAVTSSLGVDAPTDPGTLEDARAWLRHIRSSSAGGRRPAP